MLIHLLTLISLFSADLIAPFDYSESFNKIGHWQISGDSSQISSDKITLIESDFDVGPGGAWSRQPLNPRGEWYVLFHINITNHTMHSLNNEDGCFGIWLTPHYGATDGICGGPKTLNKSAAALFRVFDHDIRLKVDLADQNSNFSLTNVTSQFKRNAQMVNKLFVKKKIDNWDYVDLRKGTELFILIGFDNSEDLLSLEVADKSVKYNITVDETFDKKNAWLGLTANLMGIDLLGVHYSAEPMTMKQVKILQKKNKFRPYRNPDFRTLTTEKYLLKGHRSHTKQKGAKNVLYAIEEINHVIGSISTFMEANSIFQKIMIPFSLAWNRRAFKQTENATRIITEIDQSLNESEDWIEYFNHSVVNFLVDTVNNISSLPQSISNDIMNLTYDEEETPKNEIGFNSSIGFMACVSIVEIVFVLFFILFLICKARKKTVK